MIDGFGTDYLAASEMPALKGLMARGFSKTVRGVMPSVTNVNNASIACGVWPEQHGITGNSFYDETRGELDYMESASYVRVPTVFQRAARRGVRSALLTAKKKTLALLSPGTAIAIAAEEPTSSATRTRCSGTSRPISRLCR
jgi:phosphonoacetate hydrolase